MTTLTDTVPKPAIARALAHALESDGGWVLISDAGDRPDLLALGGWGALAIDIDTESASGEDPVPLKRLNGKLAQVSADVPELQDLPLHRFVLRPRDDGRRGPFALRAQTSPIWPGCASSLALTFFPKPGSL